MGNFTSKYKVTDGNGNTRVETKVDVEKSIDGIAGLLAVITLWLFVATWKFIKYLFSPKARRDSKAAKKMAGVAGKVVSGVATSKPMKVIYKIIITIFIIFSIGLAFAVASTIYQQKQDTYFNEIVDYKTLGKSLTVDNFKSIYSSNYQSSLKLIKDYESNPLSWIQNIHTIGTIRTIEGNRALKNTYGDKYRLYDYMAIINNLGNLDKGYSKELALFITDFMDRRTVIRLNESNDFESTLKKYNQMSALRAYLKLKQKYKII